VKLFTASALSLAALLSVNSSTFAQNFTAEAVTQVYNPTATDSISGNTAAGTGAVKSNTAGKWNVAMGKDALGLLTTGKWNTAMGTGAMRACTTCTENVAVGADTLKTTKQSVANVAIGSGALRYNESGVANTGVGWYALWLNRLGSRNIAIGNGAGAQIFKDDNIMIGHSGFDADVGVIRIGDGYFHKKVYIADVDLLAKIAELEARLQALEAK